MEFTTQSARETQGIGRDFGASLKKGGVIALVGQLGAGKTTFVQGFAQGLGLANRIISPTFILVRSYGNFYHVDLYRLEKNLEEEVENLGLTDIWRDPANVVIIEWAEKIKELLPKNTIWINFEDLGEDKRKITIKRRK